MNQQEREKMDALIRGFLDGELTQRQRTELKRVVRHNPNLKKVLHALYRQKQLLSALPVDRAPEGLAEAVRSKLERRMILDTGPAEEIRPIGRAHLFLRRMAAVAAMLFIPLAILGIIVFQIMKPAEEVFTAAPPPAQVNPSGDLALLERNVGTESPVPLTTIAIGRLTLMTDQPVAVNEAIMKAVLKNNLISQTTADRSRPPGTVYQIQCNQQQMLAFSEDLSRIWQQCSGRRLTVSSGDSRVLKEVVIEDIRPEQMRILMEQTNPVRFRMIASSIERQNRMNRADTLRGTQAGGEDSQTPLLYPVEPRIAWDQRRPDRPSEPEDDPSVPRDEITMHLIVEIKTAVEGERGG